LSPLRCLVSMAMERRQCVAAAGAPGFDLAKGVFGRVVARECKWQCADNVLHAAWQRGISRRA